MSKRQQPARKRQDDLLPYAVILVFGNQPLFPVGQRQLRLAVPLHIGEVDKIALVDTEKLIAQGQSCARIRDVR